MPISFQRCLSLVFGALNIIESALFNLNKKTINHADDLFFHYLVNQY